MDHLWKGWSIAAEAYYKEALRLDPGHADAWVHLGNQRLDEDRVAEALALYERGQAAAEARTIGDPARYPAPFWLDVDSRPFMRALHGRGLCLWRMGRVDEARQIFAQMLELNPNDNQGVRYLLMPKLLQLGRDVEAARLVKGSEEQSANWAYARALLAFRLSERPAATRRELRAAFRTNPYVPECLLEDIPLPMPSSYSPGSPEEAVLCAEELRPVFAQTEGALDWMAREHRQWQKDTESRRKAQRRKQRGQKRKGKGR
jgi:tetratricopeptide (TPR) repeat protein